MQLKNQTGVGEKKEHARAFENAFKESRRTLMSKVCTLLSEKPLVKCCNKDKEGWCTF